MRTAFALMPLDLCIRIGNTQNMVCESPRTLAAHRREAGLTIKALAEFLGVDRQTLRRYELPRGVDEARVPGHIMMLKIFMWSGGAVRPDSFYDLPELESMNV